MAALQNNEDSDSDIEMGENEPQGKCYFKLVTVNQYLLT